MGYFGEGQEIVFTEPVFKKQGGSIDGVLAGLDEIEKMDMDLLNGHVVFYATTLMDTFPAAEISKQANAKFLKKNMLFRENAPGLQKIDQEVKQMAREILAALMAIPPPQCDIQRREWHLLRNMCCQILIKTRLILCLTLTTH